uniref:Putative secreted protein n=1 Tax=Anopheles marajoara TaxID=58244 RepID=A0A2M4C448_9DIPT
MKLQILALVVCVAFVVGSEVDSGAPESITDLVQPDQAEVDNAEPAVEDPQPLEEAPEDAPDAEEEELPDQPDQEPDASVLERRIIPAVFRPPWRRRPWTLRPRILPRVL